MLSLRRIIAAHQVYDRAPFRARKKVSRALAAPAQHCLPLAYCHKTCPLLMILFDKGEAFYRSSSSTALCPLTYYDWLRPSLRPRLPYQRCCRCFSPHLARYLCRKAASESENGRGTSLCTSLVAALSDILRPPSMPRKLHQNIRRGRLTETMDCS